MNRFFLNLKLRVKLLLAFGSLLLLSTALVLWFFQISSRRDEFRKASETTDVVGMQLLEVNASIQYFMFEGYKAESFHLKKQSDRLELVNERIRQVQSGLQQMAGINTNTDAYLRATQALAALNKDFNSLCGLLHLRGFKDFGLEGELRQAIHHVENTSYPFNKASMLMLRRHEKDFFLRKDLKYVDEFRKQMNSFEAEIEALPLNEGKQAILNDLRKYNQSFLRVAEIEEQLGLKENLGARGKINEELRTLNRWVDEIRNKIKSDASAFEQQANFWLLLVFALQLAIGISLAVFYADVIARAIKEINRAIGQLSEGIFPTPLLVKSNEEIGQTKKSFNQLLLRIQAATQFSDQLGNGHLQTKYDSRFTGDILGQSLVKMQQQLARAAQEQAMINWTNEGTARLADVLQHENDHLAQWCDHVLKGLIQYVGLNQGALYLRQQDGLDNDYLERMATYAYGKKRFVDHRLPVGSGLVGQCVLEKETIQLTDVPVDYIKITSGLGESTPRYVVLLPLVHQNHALGVLELAGFETLKDFEVRFLEKSAEAIAAVLFSRKSADDTRRLLDEARLREEQLTAQDEELRQNAEEMQSVQEQMQRKYAEIERQLKTQNLTFQKKMA